MIEFEFRNVDYLLWEENWRTRRNILKLNSHVTPSPKIKPEIAVVRGKRLAATPPMLPQMLPQNLIIDEGHKFISSYGSLFIPS
jgi:hypothetical protein